MDCGALTDPADGQVSHTAGTTFRQTATYTCNKGFNLVGDSTRMCQAAKWSGSEPTCQRMSTIVYFTKSSCPVRHNNSAMSTKTYQLAFCQILHVLFLRIHHHYVTYCCPYVMNVVLLTCQESNTKVFVTLTQKKKKKGRNISIL